MCVASDCWQNACHAYCSTYRYGRTDSAVVVVSMCARTTFITIAANNNTTDLNAHCFCALQFVFFMFHAFTSLHLNSTYLLYGRKETSIRFGFEMVVVRLLKQR